jgi:hypothetical protein
MRTTIGSALLLGLGLVFVNAFVLAPARRGLSRQSAALRTAAADIDERREGDELSRQRDRTLRLLADAALERNLDEPLGIARLREHLVRAEAGLAVDRMSLDFRPDDDAGERFDGVLITGTFVSDYPSLRDYLGRVEASKLPLVVDDLAFRADNAGRTSLSIRWSVRWRGASEPGLDAWMPTPMEATILTQWLEHETRGAPSRNPFASGTSDTFPVSSLPFAEVDTPQDAPVSPAAPPAAEAHDDTGTGPEPSFALVGFVLARPELERNVDRRVLAAIRYEGQMLLVGTADRVGSFFVARIDARDSVTLRDEGSGKTIVLRLE